ncbi:sensor histidine kinase [Cupriavidus basilensis]
MRLAHPRFDEPRLLAAEMELIDQSFGIAMLGCALAAFILALGLALGGGRPGAFPWALAMGLACAAGHFGRRRLPERTEPSQSGSLRPCHDGLADTDRRALGAGGMAIHGREVARDGDLHPVADRRHERGRAGGVLRLPAGRRGLLRAGHRAGLGGLHRHRRCRLSGHVPRHAALSRCTHDLCAQLRARGAPRHRAALCQRGTDLAIARADRPRGKRTTRGRRKPTAAKSVFLASASHDLRQPLRALGLFVVTLEPVRSHRQAAPVAARTIEAASCAAREMLNTLLDFSKVDAGVITARRAFRLQPLLYKLENEFAPQADGRGLFYRTRDTTATVFADPTLVELILRNLIANAIRYTSQGGVLVACRRRGKQHGARGLGYRRRHPRVPASRHLQEFHQLGNPER